MGDGGRPIERARRYDGATVAGVASRMSPSFVAFLLQRDAAIVT